MPLFTLILIAIGLVGFALAAAAWLRHLRAPRPSARTWPLIGLGALLLGLSSALVVTERHSGTGDLRSYGWPKPFCFAWQSWEDQSRSSDCNPLYFLGDAVFYASALLALAMLWRLVRFLMSGRRK